MGKGFNNYMCKKFFHPASRENLKRVWMAEQKADAYKKKQEELKLQYEKEQDLYTNKAMLSKESKDKLSVNFMYEPPPGTKKEREKEDDEPEYKFEWQRKFNAPREDYCKGVSEIRDQPFGIQVRNVRCIKCHKWGHINTDKECPMYNQSSSTDQPNTASDPLILIQQMRDDGLAMKKGALNLQQLMSVENKQLPIEAKEGTQLTDGDAEFLKSLSLKQKKRLLRKLTKLEQKFFTERSIKKEKKKKRNDHSSDSESSSSGANDKILHKTKKISSKTSNHKSRRKQDDSSSDDSDSKSTDGKGKLELYNGKRYHNDVNHKSSKHGMVNGHSNEETQRKHSHDRTERRYEDRRREREKDYRQKTSRNYEHRPSKY